MSNIKLIITIILVGFTNMSYSQKYENNEAYQSYKTNTIPYHLLIFEKNKLIIEIPRKDAITFGTRTVFSTQTKKDTIFILNELTNVAKQKGIVVTNHFTNQFINSKIYKKSNNELLFIDKNRPYFKKELIDSLIGNNTIYYINEKLYKASDENQINIDTILKKPKRAKIKIWKGKEAYEKYGIIGLNGVIEISDRKRRCK
jgi:hypothetical protein